jgi:hypothetical protein
MPPPFFFDFFAAVNEGRSAMEMRMGDQREPQGITYHVVPHFHTVTVNGLPSNTLVPGRVCQLQCLARDQGSISDSEDTVVH